jgi:hypothetical protein
MAYPSTGPVRSRDLRGPRSIVPSGGRRAGGRGFARDRGAWGRPGAAWTLGRLAVFCQAPCRVCRRFLTFAHERSPRSIHLTLPDAARNRALRFPL